MTDSTKDKPKVNLRDYIHNIRDLNVGINELYEKGISKGEYLGFDEFHEHYSMKLGCTTYIMSAPASGKTEFTLECLLNLSETKGWRHLISSPETGSKEEILAELISKYCRKPFYKNYSNHLTQYDLLRALAFLDHHFIIVDPGDNDISIDNLYQMADMLENDGFRIHTIMADPFNEYSVEGTDRQDIALEKILAKARRNARAKNRHNIIVTHCRDQLPVLDKETNKFYYAAPTAREYAGGQVWFRKGLGMLGFWRPPSWLKDENGYPYSENELHVFIQKAKPKGIGKIGKVVLYFDIHTNRYYTVRNGMNIYSNNTDFEGKKINAPASNQIMPNNNIFKTINKEFVQDDTIAPF